MKNRPPGRLSLPRGKVLQSELGVLTGSEFSTLGSCPMQVLVTSENLREWRYHCSVEWELIF